jgi:DNA mismatch repair ATPase MutS
MDEIFHATNAHDGLLSSEIVYGSMLGRFPKGLLFLSTHYRDLVTSTGSRAAALCVGSDIRSDGSLAYTYRVYPGVNRHSSVRELLVEHGLCSSAGAAFVADKEVERLKQNESK